MESARSHLVVTVHGIRTFGHWQERLEALVREREPGARVHHYKYGYFSCIAFMIPPLRWLVTRGFRRALVATCASGSWDRIDLVAHSFGTHIVAWALHGLPRARRPKIHTLILAGSVLKPSFPWEELTEDAVGRVVNDCGTKDGVLVLNQAVVLFTGMAGRVGFAGMNHDRFRNRFFAHGHSDYFVRGGKPSDEFMREWWVPALCGDGPTSLPPDPRGASPVQGIAAFLFNNLEPIKVALVVAPFAVLAIVYFSLFRQANAQREEARRRLVELQVTQAESLSDEGDLASALVWYCEALRSVQGGDELEQRVRVGTTLRQLPRLSQVLFRDDLQFSRAAFSPDGSQVALTGGSQPLVWNLENGTVTDLVPHDNSVNAVAFSPDGAWIATAGSDRTARVFDARNGAPVTPPMRHDAQLMLVLFRADGKRLLTVGRSGSDRRYETRLWDVPTGASVGSAMKHARDIGDAAFSPAGERVATISEDGTTRIWSAETGEPTGVTIASDDARNSSRSPLRVEFSSDGARLLTSSGATLQVWDPSTGSLLGGPWEMGTCADARFVDVDSVLAVDEDGAVQVWRVGARDAVRGKRSLGVSAGLLAIAVPRGSTPVVALGSGDGTARVFDVRSTRALTPPLRHTGAVRRLHLSADGRRLMTIDVTDVARVFDLSAPPGLVLDHSDPFDAPFIWQVSFDPSGERLLSVARDFNTARLWDAATGVSLLELRHDDAIECARFSPDGERVVTASKDRTARIWSSRSGAALGAAFEHDSTVKVVSFSGDGARLATGCENGIAHVWSVTDSSRSCPPIEHSPGDPIIAVSFTADGRRVLVTGGVSAKLYDVRTGERVTSGPRQNESGVSASALSPDGLRIATGGGDGVACIWDASTGEPVTPELVHSAGLKYANFPQKVNHVAFSADATRLATTSSDSTTRIWDAVTGVPLASPIDGANSHSAFSPGGRWIATADSSGLVRLWDARTGAAISPPWMHESSATQVAFDPAGARLASAGLDGTVRVWSLLPDERHPDALRLLAEVLACRRIDEMGGLVELTPEELRDRWTSLKAPAQR